MTTKHNIAVTYQPLWRKRSKTASLTVKRGEGKAFPHCTVNHPSF